jgi:hypothetical protein
MITFQQFTNWHIRPLTAYRFLEKQYVDDFLNNGKIRLSSFAKFRKHKDEIRGDNSEGSGFYLANHKPEVGEGHHFSALMNTGKNAYVLSTTLINKNDTFSECNYDAGFIINDVFGFALEISRAIPFFIAGMQGQCFYKDPPIIPIDVGQFNLNDLSEQEFQNKQSEFFEKTNQDNDIFFIKHLRYKPQEEYRIIWFADEAFEHIDLICPNAAKFCERI